MASSRIKKIKLFGILSIGLISILGIISVIYPFFNEKETQRVAVEGKISENSVLETRITNLKKIAEQTPQVKAFNDSLTARFPATSDIPGLVSSIAETASSAGLGSGSITALETQVPTIVPDTAASLPSSSASKPADSKGPTDNTDTGTAAAPAAGSGSTTPKAGSASQNLASMGVTLAVEGTPEQLATFVKNLSNSKGRAFLIKGFSLTSAADGKTTLSLTTETFLYRTLAAPTDPKAATPATPAPADTKTK